MSDAEQLRAIQWLLQLADRHGLAELVVEEEGLTVTIRSGSGTVALPPPGAPPSPASREESLASPAPAETDERYHAILSPMTGVFYRAASPEVPPFVEPGDRVEEGQPVGLIEAMKVYSEIPADRSGRVVEILITTGTLVSQAQPLMRLDLDD